MQCCAAGYRTPSSAMRQPLRNSLLRADSSRRRHEKQACNAPI